MTLLQLGALSWNLVRAAFLNDHRRSDHSYRPDWPDYDWGVAVYPVC